MSITNRFEDAFVGIALNCSMRRDSKEFLAAPTRHKLQEDRFELRVACSGRNLLKHSFLIIIFKK